MFGLSFSEILVVLALALLVVGPQNLPKVARSLARMYAWIRHHVNVMQREINMEMRRIEMEEREIKVPPNRPKPAPRPTAGPAYDVEAIESAKTIDIPAAAEPAGEAAVKEIPAAGPHRPVAHPPLEPPAAKESDA